MARSHRAARLLSDPKKDRSRRRRLAGGAMAVVEMVDEVEKGTCMFNIEIKAGCHGRVPWPRYSVEMQTVQKLIMSAFTWSRINVTMTPSVQRTPLVGFGLLQSFTQASTGVIEYVPRSKHVSVPIFSSQGFGFFDWRGILLRL